MQSVVSVTWEVYTEVQQLKRANAAHEFQKAWHMNFTMFIPEFLCEYEYHDNVTLQLMQPYHVKHTNGNGNAT